MKIGLAGGSYQAYSLPINAERSVNLYPFAVMNGRDQYALYATEGLKLFADVGTGAHRGEFNSTNGRVFCVSGAKFYELSADGTFIERGSLLGSDGYVTIDENVSQLFLCDGSKLYVFVYATNNFSVVNDVDLPSSVGTVCFIDNYAVVNENNTGRFYVSDVANATSWKSLEFATAESSPDFLRRVFNAFGQLWLIGERTTEVWSNTGSSDFPFERMSSLKLEMGTMAEYSVSIVDNSLFMVAQDKDGSGFVIQTNGGAPQRVSTDYIEGLLSKAPDKRKIKAWTYKNNGVSIYVLTGGGLGTSLCYDLSTQLWHERAYTFEGVFQPHLAIGHMYAFDKHLVGSRRDGKIYELSRDFHDDAGDDIVRQRIYTHVYEDGAKFRANRLEIGFEVGVGNETPPDENPICALRISRDGGRTWGMTQTASLGEIGDTLTDVIFRRLGVSKQLTFELETNARCKIAICGSYLS